MIKKTKTIYYAVRDIISPKHQRRPFVNFIFNTMNNRELVGCEIGVKYGNHALQMLYNLNIKKLYLIDPYLDYENYTMNKDQVAGKYWGDVYTQDDYDNAFDIAKNKLKKYKDKIVFVRKKSLDAVDSFDDDFFDFVFIDGNQKLMMEDLKSYYPKIRENSIIGGHDFDGEYMSTSKCIIDFAEAKNLKLHGFYREWWFIKGEPYNEDYLGSGVTKEYYDGMIARLKG